MMMTIGKAHRHTHVCMCVCMHAHMRACIHTHTWVCNVRTGTQCIQKCTEDAAVYTNYAINIDVPMHMQPVTITWCCMVRCIHDT